MPLYQKQPVVVEARQFKKGEYFKVLLWCDGAMVQDGNKVVGLLVRTREGTIRANPTDWIIKGVEGEFYPCSDSVFRKSYVKVD